MSNCDQCHHAAMSQSGLSAYSYMNIHCPDCLQPKPYPNNEGVCQNQDMFNKAFRKAVKNYNKKESPPNWALIVAFGVMLLFLVWALLLVSKMGSSPTRVMHYVLAIVFSPIYVISHYLGNMR